MDKGIKFDVMGIAEAIKHNRFVVPPNQREYSWRHDEQVMELLQDMSNAVRHTDTPYFLGTIVLTKGSSGLLEVADGQQRLATTTMILAAIRNFYRGKGDQMMIQSIENEFLFTIDRSARERVPKLTLNTDDNEFFKNMVLHPQHDRVKQVAQRRSHKLIEKAFQTIETYIKDIEKLGVEYAKEHLNQWIEYLEKQANIVMLTVSNEENAYKMFETLNDRGLKTSQVDLIKNHLFDKAGDRLPEAKRLWSTMKGVVESVSEKDDDVMIEFLRSVCCLLVGVTTKKDIMKVLKDKTPNKTEAIRMMTLFEELSQEYAAILNPEHQKWNNYSPDVRKSLQTISVFGISQIRPLMLSVAKHFNDKNSSIAFRKFVAWSVRFMILSMRGGRLDEGYSKLANKIHLGQIKNAEELKNEASKVVIGDAQFKAAFETAKVGVSKLARYYLRSLEITASNEPDPEYVPNEALVVNLEHIMPDSPGKDWEHIQTQDIESHLSRLGNLALMKAEKNNDIGNLSFEEKKKTYKESKFLLTAQLSEINVWDTEQIDNRQKVMADLAVKTWPL